MKKTIYVSDLSGNAIEEGHEAQILVTYRENGRKTGYKLDATVEEAKEFGRAGKPVKFSTGRKKTTSDQLASLSA